jgi:putative heme degradation protein
MGGRKLPGGAEIIQRLHEHIQAVRDAIDVDRRTIVLRPEEMEDRRDQALELLRQMTNLLDRDLPPLLERSERNRKVASLPDRVDRLEAEISELRKALEARGDLRIVRRAEG